VFSKDTLELTPDNCTTETLCVCVANTLEKSVAKLLFTVFEEVKVTAVVDSVKVVFDYLGVV
jgi:hypothetical protein